MARIIGGIGTSHVPTIGLYFYNDHATTFSFDHYPSFALGVGDEFAIADEGLGPRRIPSIKSHAALARHLAHSLINDEFDERAAMERAGLGDEERRLVRERDWLGLIRYGASFFTMEKLGRVSGVSNPEMIAAMRVASLQEFLKTRNVPGAR
jgi:hypothetical protein